MHNIKNLLIYFEKDVIKYVYRQANGPADLLAVLARVQQEIMFLRDLLGWLINCSMCHANVVGQFSGKLM